MNVGEKLNNLPISTVIHIESLNHWNLIQKHTDLIADYIGEVLSKNFCIRKIRNNYYTWSYLDDYTNNKKYNSNIISSSSLFDSIYECW